MFKSLLIALILILAIPALAQDTGNKISPRLDQAMNQPPPSMLNPDGTLGIWVHFTDKALSGAALSAALDAAEQAMPERTLRRRAKVKEAGARLVDTGDLPLAPDYLAAVSATGAQPRKQSRWLNTASFNATAEQVAAIARLPFVERVSLVAQFFRPVPKVSDAEADAAKLAREKAEAEATGRWSLDYGGSTAGLQQINVPPVHEMGLSGSGVIVGMLDSGFRVTHIALQGIPVIAQWDFVDDDPIVDEEEGDPTYSARHGTQTLSTVMGFQNGELVGPAYQASVILARTEDVGDETPIEEDYWVAGLEWVEMQGADLVSSSLGYYYWYEFSDLDGDTAVSTVAGDAAVDRGLGVFTSAGNERQNEDFPHIIAPADGHNIVAMAAVDLGGNIASFSSPGPTFDGRIKPDVSAQGVSNFVASYYDNASYHTADGTSFACPLVAGVATLMLERIPSLAPLQVREALRETADRAGSPDNDYGWGIIDAHAAVTYWGPNIVHEPLGDTEDIIGPYTIIATITDREPLDPGALYLNWRLDGGSWNQVALVAGGPDQYSADIPGQPAGGLVEYYLEAGDTGGINLQMPHGGPENSWSFNVGADTTAPDIFHAGLIDQVPSSWLPPAVTATATDNLGVDRVELTFSRNGGPVQGPYLLTLVDDVYEIPFPLLTVEVGDEVSYELVAYDTAAVPNQASSGPHTFYVVNSLGTVMVINDNALDPSSADLIAAWLSQGGYAVDGIDSGDLAPGNLLGYDAVVLSSGNYSFPIGDSLFRGILIDWVNEGGRILVEGGALTEVAANPWSGYPEFAATVLRAAEFWGDYLIEAQFIAAADQLQHPFLTRPYLLPSPVTIDISGPGYDFGATDIVYATPEAIPVLRTIYNNQTGGVIVYDDNTGPEAGQIVYFTFDISYMDETLGLEFAQNAMAYLLAREAPGNASISGTVTLDDNMDASGVTVSAGQDYSVVTGSDGNFILTGLHGATYRVTATREGYGPSTRTVTLAADEQMGEVDFLLHAVTEIHASASPMLPIPDNNPVGASSVITLTEVGDVFDISVDIDLSHPSIGQLVVTLTSPSGTQVTLHNRTGSINDDIVGNWPETLTVDGPGALEDYLVGNSVQGDWTLHVADMQFGAMGGVLNTWGLNLLAVGPGVSAAPDELPRVTRLVGNAPNPFNPITTIDFELARRGFVQLDIFDLRGRHVRQLVSELRDPGKHQVIWDGRDANNRGTASGVYFCRMNAKGYTQMHKMMLIR